MNGFKHLKKPIIYLITRGNLTDDNYKYKSRETLEILKFAILSKISLIQVREKNLSAKYIYELTAATVKLAENSKTKILVNERADIALAANADGVHLTSNAVPTEIIRRNFPQNFIIGVSTHTPEKAEQAKNKGADFAVFSPIFPTRSKENFVHPQGLKKLKEVCEKLKPFPILALGGIDANNFQTTLDNGASGFAGISFLNSREILTFDFDTKII